MELSDFEEIYPQIYDCNIKSLYRFTKLNEAHPEYLRDILIDKKLYHATPDQFNDPFECKPSWKWPETNTKRKAIRSHLIKLYRKRGVSLRKAEEETTKMMVNPEETGRLFIDAAHQTLSKIRICSFTTDKNNLLFWSHYADSHKGFCLEFDATKMPVMGAYKVKYQCDYPMIEYPVPRDARAFPPILTKFKKWEYEEEFRTVFVPNVKFQPPNNGQSMLLEGNEIKSLFFGAKIDPEHKDTILDMVKKGPFAPNIYDARLSKSSYSLEFEPYSL